MILFENLMVKLQEINKIRNRGNLRENLLVFVFFTNKILLAQRRLEEILIIIHANMEMIIDKTKNNFMLLPLDQLFNIIYE